MQDDLARHRSAGSARLIIVDDHELARAGLRTMLTGVSGIEIVGEALNGREAVQMTGFLRPDIVLLDVRMPEMDGLTATRAIKQTVPHTHILIVTMYENPDYLVEAFKAGASGFLLKDATRQELITAIRRVLSGRSIFNEEVVRRTLNRFATESDLKSGRPTEPLTPRERDVLRLLAQGRTNREIANNLAVSVGTVKIHVQHIISKLGVADRTQAAVRAVELGLVAPHI